MKRMIFYQHAKTRNTLLSQYDYTKVASRSLAADKIPKSPLSDVLNLFSNNKKTPSQKSEKTAEQSVLPKKQSCDPKTIANADKKLTSSFADVLNSFSNTKTAVNLNHMTAEQFVLPKKRSRNRLPATLKQAKEKRKHALDKNNDDVAQEKALGKVVVHAAEQVAEALGDKNVKSDLLCKLVSLEKETFSASKPAPSDSDTAQSSNMFSFLRDMKVEKEKTDTTASKSIFDDADVQSQFDTDFLAQIEASNFLDEIGVNDVGSSQRRSRREKWGKFRREAPGEPPTDSFPIVNIYDGPRLNIFAAVDPNTVTTTDAIANTTNSLLPEWDAWEKQNLERLSHPSPRNGFEEMIEWTKCGKMFPYPIDNEYGFFEKFTPFHEHIFLNHTLNDDRVPKSGPVFEFMNLVVLGLSKNPYMLLERKHEHIEWFKDYFKDKTAELQSMKDNEDSLTESNT